MKKAKTWGSAALFFVVTTVLCGVIYTAVCTGLAQLIFPHQANGSIIEVDGTAYGSELVGQRFTDDTHLWGLSLIHISSAACATNAWTWPPPIWAWRA